MLSWRLRQKGTRALETTQPFLPRELSRQPAPHPHPRETLASGCPAAGAGWRGCVWWVETSLLFFPGNQHLIRWPGLPGSPATAPSKQHLLLIKKSGREATFHKEGTLGTTREASPSPRCHVPISCGLRIPPPLHVQPPPLQAGLMDMPEPCKRSVKSKRRLHRGLFSTGWPGVGFPTSQLKDSTLKTLKSLYTCEVKSKGRKSEWYSHKVSYQPNSLASLA